MPLGLSGGYAAGGMNDTLFQLAKQRLLEQELAQRAQEAEYQRMRGERQDTAAADERTYQHGQDLANTTRQGELDKRAIAVETRQKGEAELKALTGQRESDLIDPATRGLDAPAAVGIPKGFGVPAMGKPMNPGIRQGRIKTVKIGDVDVTPMSREALSGLADEAMGRDILTREAGRASTAPNVGTFEDYVTRLHGQNPTPGQIMEARRKWDLTSERNPNGELTNYQQLLTADRLSKAYDKASAPHNEMQRQVSIMDEGLKAAEAGNRAVGGQAILITFNKILDPNSVVRESEYLRSAAGQSMLNQLRGYVQRLEKGGPGNIPIEELHTFVDFARAIASQENAYVSGVRRRIDATAKKYGIDPEIVFSDYAPGGGDDDPFGFNGGGGGTGKNSDNPAGLDVPPPPRGAGPGLGLPSRPIASHSIPRKGIF